MGKEMDKDAYRDEDFAELCVEQLFDEHPEIEGRVSRDELKNDIKSKLKTDNDKKKLQHRMFGPKHFVMDFIRSTAKYAIIAALLAAPYLNQQSNGQTQDDDGGQTDDMVFVETKYVGGDEKKKKRDVYKPKEDELIHIKVLNVFSDLLDRWFRIHNVCSAVNFRANATEAINMAKASPLIEKNSFNAMINATFLGKAGREHIVDKLQEIKMRLDRLSSQSTSREK
jgi:hypothetical protein